MDSKKDKKSAAENEENVPEVNIEGGDENDDDKLSDSDNECSADEDDNENESGSDKEFVRGLITDIFGESDDDNEFEGFKEDEIGADISFKYSPTKNKETNTIMSNSHDKELEKDEKDEEQGIMEDVPAPSEFREVEVPEEEPPKKKKKVDSDDDGGREISKPASDAEDRADSVPSSSARPPIAYVSSYYMQQYVHIQSQKGRQSAPYGGAPPSLIEQQENSMPPEAVESLLKSEESGKDLVSIQDLIKINKLVEADVKCHEDRIHDMNNLADSLIESGQCDAVVIEEKQSSISERYNRKKNLAPVLHKKNTLHQFFRDIADEESWIKEKKVLVNSDDFGRDLTGVQNLSKKHVHLEAELATHEPTIEAVQEAGQKLMTESNLGVPEMMTSDQGAKLNESLSYKNFLAKLGEEEAWISEKDKLLNVEYYGDTMAEVQIILKKHEAFENDFVVHSERCEEISIEGQQVIAKGNHHTQSISRHLQQLHDRLHALDSSATRREIKLKHNSAYLHFMWMADVVETWIANKESHVRPEDYAQDVSSVQTLLSEQEIFDADFEQEGIQILSKLKFELLKDNHEQTSAIIKRHDDVMERWNNLLAASEARKQRLLHMLEQFKQVKVPEEKVPDLENLKKKILQLHLENVSVKKEIKTLENEGFTEDMYDEYIIKVKEIEATKELAKRLIKSIGIAEKKTPGTVEEELFTFIGQLNM